VVRNIEICQFACSIYLLTLLVKANSITLPGLSWFFRFLHDVDVKWKDTEEMPLMKYLKPVFYFRITITVLLASEAMSTNIYCMIDATLSNAVWFVRTKGNLLFIHFLLIF
jgi:hypothetical protein